MQQQKLNLFEEPLKVTDRVKERDEQEKHLANTFQSTINAFYQTNFLNSGSIKALKLAIQMEKFAIDNGFSVEGILAKDNRLYRVKVTNEPIQRLTNLLTDRYEDFINKYKDYDFVPIEIISVYLRGSEYRYGEYVYNKKLRQIGLVKGYYLDSRRKKSRFKVLTYDFKIEDHYSKPSFSLTDWDKGDNLVCFKTKTELNRFIRKLDGLNENRKSYLTVASMALDMNKHLL